VSEMKAEETDKATASKNQDKEGPYDIHRRQEQDINIHDKIHKLEQDSHHFRTMPCF